MMIKIDKNIPIPEKYSRRIYPFGDMKVGDSFLVPDDRRNSVSFAASQFRKRHQGFAFTVRKIDGVVRCWRIE